MPCVAVGVDLARRSSPRWTVANAILMVPVVERGELRRTGAGDQYCIDQQDGQTILAKMVSSINVFLPSERKRLACGARTRRGGY